MPSSVTDRENRENWAKAGGMDLLQRATAEVERRLAAYEPPEIDAKAVSEMQRIIISGMSAPAPLPDVPAPSRSNTHSADNTRRRRRFAR